MATLSQTGSTTSSVTLTVSGLDSAHSRTRYFWWQLYYGGSVVSEHGTSMAPGGTSHSTSFTGLSGGTTYSVQVGIYDDSSYQTLLALLSGTATTDTPDVTCYVVKYYDGTSQGVYTTYTLTPGTTAYASTYKPSTPTGYTYQYCMLNGLTQVSSFTVPSSDFYLDYFYTRTPININGFTASQTSAGAKTVSFRFQTDILGTKYAIYDENNVQQKASVLSARTVTSSFTVTNVTFGSRTFRLKVWNGDSQTDTATVTITMTAPAITGFTVTQSAPGSTTANFSFTLNCTGQSYTIKESGVTKASGSISTSSGSGTMTLTLGSTHTLVLSVTFANGSDTETTTVTMQEDTGPFIWDGSEWKHATPYIWDGSSWVQATAYIWNGSEWKS